MTIPQKKLKFISFITTGPLPHNDSIMETAFVSIESGQEVDYQTFLANPGEIPLTTQKLTGLNHDRVAGKKGPREVTGKMLSELETGPVVVHDAAMFNDFLQELHLHPPRPLFDSLELAEIIFPESSDFSLTAVADRLGIEPVKMHRGLDLARLTRTVWEKLCEKAGHLPHQVLKALCELAHTSNAELEDVLTRITNENLGFKLSSENETPDIGDIFNSHTHIFTKAQQYNELEPKDEPLDTDKIRAMFKKDGAIGRHLPHFEPREEQMEMAGIVCEALNQGQHLMCEAGTGTGKSMAYLLPAIAWARQNEDKIIVSTNTKNLQQQLYEKDIPFLKKLLGSRFQTALLKGRRNYLCLRRFLNLIEYHKNELSDPSDAETLMPVLTWSAATQTGDISECSGFLKQRRAGALMALITATGDECTGRSCRFYNKCFIRKARTLAQLADLIVVNHALAFADVTLDKPYLPRERCIVFDEAHNIEQVATEAASVVSDSLSFYRICRRLWYQKKNGAGSGMVSILMNMINKHFPESGPLARDTSMEMARGVVEAADELAETARNFFDRLSEPFQYRQQNEYRIMLEECRPPIKAEGEIGDMAEMLIESGKLLQSRINNLVECVEAHEETFDKAPEFIQDLSGQKNRLTEAMENLEFILKRENENYVYWLQRVQRGKRNFYGLQAAPLEIGQFMRTFFFDEMRSVILTSATLRVNRKFDYIKERLGADHLDEERLLCTDFGSPFDFQHQAMLCVPTFLPDAGGQRDMTYDEELASFLIDLLRGTAGRSLVLFTSYSLLNTVYERIKSPLESVNVPLLAQGRDGSRATLTKLFKENVGSVLLGTQSFWEGVDVLGESLSCLVLTKLPFHVFTDPLVQGRIQHLRDHGIDPFRHYTLPEAIVNFRQGFGRLIRHRNDRGIVVVTDKRLVTKSYGRGFLSDIPTRHQIFKSRDPLILAVKRFLKKNK